MPGGTKKSSVESASNKLQIITDYYVYMFVQLTLKYHYLFEFSYVFPHAGLSVSRLTQKLDDSFFIKVGR